MADSLFSIGASTGKKAGQYKASLYDIESGDQQRMLSQELSNVKQDQFNKTIGTISDTLSIASKLYGTYEDTKSDIDALESEYGELKTTEGDKFYQKGRLGKGIRMAKMMAGTGEYTFGDTDISGKDLSFEANLAKYGVESMLDEAMGGSGKKIKRPKQKIQSSDIDIEGNVKVEDLTQDSEFMSLDPLEGPTLSGKPLEAEQNMYNQAMSSPDYMTEGGGLKTEDNLKLYEADPSMRGKSKEERVKRYEELFVYKGLGPKF